MPSTSTKALQGWAATIGGSGRQRRWRQQGQGQAAWLGQAHACIDARSGLALTRAPVLQGSRQPSPFRPQKPGAADRYQTSTLAAISPF